MSRIVDFDDGFTSETPPTDTALATQAELDAHLSDTTAAHAASAVSFTPAGTIAATDAQAAIAEVATDAATALASHEADTTAIHGISDTSALSYKTASETLSTKTFSDPITLTEVASPAAPAASKRKIYTKSDGKLYHMGSDGLEKAVGSGSGGGGLNLLTLGSTYSIDNGDDADAESTVGRWTQYADAAATSPVDMTGGTPGSTAPARSTTAPLNGSASIVWDLGTGSSRQGEGMVSGTVYVPPGYRGRTLVFKGVFAATGAIVDGDIVPYAYDVTNSALIKPYTYGKILGAGGAFGAQVDIPSTCAQLRIGFHVARSSSGSLSLKFDDLKLTDEQSARGLAGSNETAYTPTFTGFGTVTVQDFTWSRVGDRLTVRGKFTSGTSTATEARISLPSGLTIDSTKNASIRKVGSGAYVATSTANQIQVLAEPGVSYFTLGNQAAASGGVTKVNASSIGGSGDAISIDATVPISGWDANVTMAESSTFKISSYLANGTRVTSTPTKLGEYRTRTRTVSTTTYNDNAPGTAPSVADGMKIFNARLWAGAEVTANTEWWEVFVGKNKNVTFEKFMNTGRTGQMDTSTHFEGANSAFGMLAHYDPSTGIASVKGFIPGSAVTSFVALGRGLDASNPTSGYWDATVSENALAVGVDGVRKQVVVGSAQTSNGILTSTTFGNPTNQPTITFTATASAKYKISYAASVVSSTTTGFIRLNNSSGSATINFSQEAVNDSSGNYVPFYIYQIVTLTAGTSYTFNVQVKSASGSVTLASGVATNGTAIIAEQIE